MVRASQQVNDAATAGVIVRPPFLYLGCLVLGLALEQLLPLRLGSPTAAVLSWTGGGGLMLVGAAIMVLGVRNFSRAKTPVPSNQPVRALVTTGIHGWSRNPIYVAMLLLYVGIGIAARSPWALVLALPLVVILRYGVVAREERYLVQHFGDTYRDYKGRVRRWL